jgi:hypothetical protein
MNDLISTLISLSGEENTIVVRRSFVQFTGTLEAGMLLSQLLYWTPKSTMNGWIAKTDDDFSNELCLTQYAVRKARSELEKCGILETKLKKFNGAPTVHYRLDLDALQRKWISWIQKTDFAKTQNGSCENAKSITETTAEITPEIIDDSADASSSMPQGSDDGRPSDLHPLNPWTEAERLLLDRVNVERKAKRYRLLTKFTTQAAKDRYSNCSAGVDIKRVDAAITCALQQGIMSVPKVVGYVEAVLSKKPKPSYNNNGRQAQPTGEVLGSISKEAGMILREELRKDKQREREAEEKRLFDLQLQAAKRTFICPYCKKADEPLNLDELADLGYHDHEPCNLWATGQTRAAIEYVQNKLDSAFKVGSTEAYARAY